MKPTLLKNQQPLTAARLRHLLAYDQHTGIFTRLVQTTPAVQIGDVAGTLTRNGYVQISVDGTFYYAHRLAWFYMTGKWPAEDIDHMDGMRANNQFANLRSATRQVNAQNKRRASSNSKAGLLGVSHTTNGKPFARIGNDGKQTFLGVFDSAQEAHAAYVSAKRQLHAGCLI